MEKWQYYKLVSKLSKDSYTKIFIAHNSQREISKKMRIVN